MKKFLIKTAEALSGPQASFEFTDIPQTYTHLLLVTSLRNTSATAGWADAYVRFNNTTANLKSVGLYGWGTSLGTISPTEIYHQMIGGGNAAGYFSNSSLTILNYSDTVKKAISVETGTENTGTNIRAIVSGAYSNTTPISSIQIVPSSDSFAQFSSANLYGIVSGSSGGVTIS